MLMALLLISSAAMAQTTTKPPGVVSIGAGFFRNTVTDSVYIELTGSPKRYYNLGIYGKINSKIADSLISINTKLALKADKTTTVNGHPLSANVTITSTDVGLGNVDNTSDINKPISSAAQEALDLKIPLSQKAAVNGVATLGADGKVPNSQIPAIALTNTYPVNSEVEMLALPAEMGDIAVRDDIDKSFVLKDPPASTLSNWIELLSPSVINTDQVPEGSANLYYTEARVNANANVAANTANRHAPVTVGTANGLSLAGQQLSLGLASGSAAGALSAADWNTFNSKQAAGSYALTNGTNATGTWPIGITGNAATSSATTLWGGLDANFSTAGSSIVEIMGRETGTGTARSYPASAVRTFLGIPSGGETLQSVTNRGATTNTGMTIHSNMTIGDNFTVGVNFLTLSPSSANPFRIQSSLAGTGSSHLTINPDGGNVGIGTTTPLAKLDVNGDTHSFATAQDNRIILSSSASANGSVIQATNAANSAVKDILLQTSGGNVGINTVSPSAKLQVNGFIRSTSQSGAPTNGTGIEMYYDGTQGVLEAYDWSNSVYKPMLYGGTSHTFNNAVTAPTFNGNLNGSANQWNGRSYNDAAITSTSPAYVMAMKADGVYAPHQASAIQSFLSLGSLAYRNEQYGSEVVTFVGDAAYDSGVGKLLRWKNYGNGHVIFDASAGTSPSGSAIDQTDAANGWTSGYPTLMGWNGTSTYGVRVDRAKLADNANSVAWTNVSGRPTALSSFTNDPGFITAASISGKEDVSNKSTSASLGSSDILYPTQKAVRDYVVGQLSFYHPYVQHVSTSTPVTTAYFTSTYICANNVDITLPDATDAFTHLGMTVTIRGINSSASFNVYSAVNGQLELATFGTFGGGFTEPGGSSKVYTFQSDGSVWRRIR